MVVGDRVVLESKRIPPKDYKGESLVKGIIYTITATWDYGAVGSGAVQLEGYGNWWFDNFNFVKYEQKTEKPILDNGKIIVL